MHHHTHNTHASTTASDETCALIHSCWVQPTLVSPPSFVDLECFCVPVAAVSSTDVSRDVSRRTSRRVCVWSSSAVAAGFKGWVPEILRADREEQMSFQRRLTHSTHGLQLHTHPVMSRRPQTRRINRKSLHQKELTALLSVSVSLPLIPSTFKVGIPTLDSVFQVSLLHLSLNPPTEPVKTFLT